MSKMLRSLNIVISTFRRKTNLVRDYRHHAFGKYLLFTNIISSGVPMLLGDLLQQELEYQKNKLSKRYDYSRLGRMLLIGLAMGPLHHYFYINLNKYFPGRSLNTIFKKLMVDQLFMGPICIALFFSGMGLLEEKSVKDIRSEIKNKFVEVYLMDWCIWPPTQFINFYFVPVKYQVMYINFITVLYDIFLSYVKHREHAQDVDEKMKIIEKQN